MANSLTTKVNPLPSLIKEEAKVEIDRLIEKGFTPLDANRIVFGALGVVVK